MPITLKDAADAALKLLGHINEQGSIDENREAKYYGAAAALAEPLQDDLLRREGKIPAGPLAALTDTLSVSDGTARGVLPYGLAMRFAQLDGDTDGFNAFAAEYYGSRLPTIAAEPPDAEDYYGVRSDPYFG